MRLAIATIILISSVALAMATHCKDVNQNLMACHSPNDHVNNCNTITMPGDCNSSKLYTINQFPMGTQPGLYKTHQPSKQCFKYWNCHYDTVAMKCTSAGGGWSVWKLKPKTERNGGGQNCNHQ